MANYTALNLREVENQGERFGIDPDELQLRMGKDPLNCANAGISYLRLGPGYRVPFGHTHKQQEEIYVVVGGKARMKIEDEVIDVEPLTAVRVAPETTRGIEGGPDGAELIVVGAPRTPAGDADMHQDWWTD